ncbi:MAG TPA: tRNA (adenosine(37)-N6)-threonylcarbamoyltransferase complex transferase subunit TsaD [Ignavibacteria bacterium]|nr:tRNA (adenosine(37)-N6)-threonylcarbamoyltransferase complex transferase subunit TsaD [Ignavibacteria bacterium]HRJ98235.1 tRNA (adenosine(37)-N6)-threonylcarbamoyltransferase complex transferase subunit TsaD [Ignavibacteria bacterium]
MIILAVETSCDETSASVLENDKVLSNIISSQISHNLFGGVVPDLASREHLSNISSIVNKSLIESSKQLKDIYVIAATCEPGLIGSLLIGMNYSKALAFSLSVPFIPVNHIQAHLYSNFLNGQQADFPFIGLIVSGGHTLLILVENFFRHRIIGYTLDDAAGEAFDKTAKLLGLGYPGGHHIDRLSKTGNSKFHKFPLTIVKDNKYNFSFSGIKTSVLYYLRKINFENKKSDALVSDIAASFQEAVTESLFYNTLKAAEEYGVKIISVSGGVSANSRLKEKFEKLKASGYKIYFPKPEYASDNAAMIGLTGYLKYIHSKDKNEFSSDSFNHLAKPRLDYENF